MKIDKYESDLYFGYQPNWIDIFDEWDFFNEEIENNVDAFCDTQLIDFKSGIFALYGKGLSGKSTFLLRIANQLNTKGFEVWHYKGKYFNYFEFYKWIKMNSDTKYFALIYDDASYNYKDISRLINLMPSNQQLIIITTSRFPSHIRSRYNIVDVEHQEYYLKPVIDRKYAYSIVNKLEEKGYLGTLKKFENINDRVDYLIKKNDLLSVMYDITYGKEFHARLNDGLVTILNNGGEERDVLFILSIFERVDLPFLPKELLTMIYGSKSSSILQNIEDYIKYNTNGDVSLRTGFFLLTIYKKISKKKKISILKNILLTISPQLDDKHNLWNQIEAACIKEKVLRKKLHLTTSEIRDMLYELKRELSGSYNYWIQLGIAEQMQSEFDKALNHFRQAEVLNSTSYMVKNAIGRNYLKQANATKNFSLAKRIFEEGEDILLELISKREEHQVRAFSTHTYLHEKINFFKNFKIVPTNKELKDMFSLLKKLLDKDSEDIMAKQISNYFLDYLTTIRRRNIVKIGYYDLDLLKSMLSDHQVDVDDLSDE